MTGTAEDIADRIIAIGQATLTPSPTIFTGELPSSPNDVIAVKELPGGSSSMAMGRVVADHPDVQVIVRRSAYAALVSTVNAIIGNGSASAPSGLDNWKGTIDGKTYHHIKLAYQPTYLGRDESNRRQTSITFQITRQR